MSDTIAALKRAVSFAKLNPAAFQAWLVRSLAKLGILAILLIVAYAQGVDNTNVKWNATLAKQRAAIAEQKASNTIDAGKRLGDYRYTDAQIDAAVLEAKAAVHAYYKDHPETRTVEKTKLVPVPGKEEYVYVPIGTCPNDFFNADELRLYNLGNEGFLTNPEHPK